MQRRPTTRSTLISILVLLAVLFAILAAPVALAQTTNSDILPATTGKRVGSPSQRFDGYFRNLNITGTFDIPGLTVSGHPVIDSSRNGDFLSLKTNSVTRIDGSGNATLGSVTATSVNGTIMADSQAGGDFCAKISAAVSAAPATGAIINAVGLSGTQSCASTLTISKPVTVILGATVLTLNGNPGINITSKGVTLEGLHHVTAGVTTSGANASRLISGASGPLIQNLTSGNDGTTLTNLELDCNSVGTFGFHTSRTGAAAHIFRGINVHGCTTVGVECLGGLCDLRQSIIHNNAQGIAWGSDGYRGLG